MIDKLQNIKLFRQLDNNDNDKNLDSDNIDNKKNLFPKFNEKIKSHYFF